MEKDKPILITLTGPSLSGKSTLFNHLRDVEKIPCIISTTTRAPRVGEVAEKDYFFISKDESQKLEQSDSFIELVIYGKTRYGVTRQEFKNKLSSGLAVIIVEPRGLEQYEKILREIGGINLKYFVNTDVEIRIERFKKRLFSDVDSLMYPSIGNYILTKSEHKEKALGTIETHVDRLISMLTIEHRWYEKSAWNRILDGSKTVEFNTNVILNDVRGIKLKDY